ncbi:MULTISPECIES: hypothetical protein [unclassified Pseudovibrio]|uniref:hypothetical protein n=1 Tax=unclassified Pseudovibrio TaxID=2627060 RepID=UPI0007AEC1A1|nr:MULTISPECIES: hypothetical protein [unclassified Pseudovibrio]KZL01196.1 hypothetical protein PsW74_01991 [Pseudovibrio sp. W74]KZL11261.1 hypothetical protein PsAD14_01012 [Pseudovibrio sp. Ad14]KZL15664.1 hypothetical protein PsAD26_01028 [Pseudovibrio sp. Ad26]
MLSIIRGLFQRDLGSATIEFSLISGLIALAILAMVSAPTLTSTSFIAKNTTAQPNAAERDLQLWELVKPNN